MRKAGRVVAEMHAATRAAARPGVTTAELDRVAREVLERRGARSNFLNYHGFPAVICASPNDMIVHGIPGGYRLEEGDILSIDCGAIVEGYHGDAAFTMGIGAIDPEAEKLIRVTEQSLWAGIEQIRAGNRLHDIGLAVQTVAEGAGFSVVREYVGHAIGTAMHEEPQVPNYWPGRPGPALKSGMVLRGRAHGQRRRAGDRPSRRRLERGHRRRQPVGPLRAHHRRDRRRPGGADPARLTAVEPARPVDATPLQVVTCQVGLPRSAAAWHPVAPRPDSFQEVSP